MADVNDGLPLPQQRKCFRAKMLLLSLARMLRLRLSNRRAFFIHNSFGTLYWTMSTFVSVMLWKCENDMNERAAKSWVMVYSWIHDVDFSMEHMRSWNRRSQSHVICMKMKMRYESYVCGCGCIRYPCSPVDAAASILHNSSRRFAFIVCVVCDERKFNKINISSVCAFHRVRRMAMQIENKTASHAVHKVEKLARVYRIRCPLECQRNLKIWNLKWNSSGITTCVEQVNCVDICWGLWQRLTHRCWIINESK